MPLSLRSAPERGDPFLFFGGQLVVGEVWRLDNVHVPQLRVLQQGRLCQASFLGRQTDVVKGDVDRRDRRARLMAHPRFLAFVRDDASVCRQNPVCDDATCPRMVAVQAPDVYLIVRVYLFYGAFLPYMP